MKNTVILISLMFSMLLLSSCWEEKNVEVSLENWKEINSIKQDNKESNLEVEITIPEYNKYNKEIDITYEEDSKELSIWSDITIKEWFPENIPEEFNIGNNEVTYINSNVENYFFYTSEKEINEILKEYSNIFKKNKWKKIKDTLDTDIEEDDEVQLDKNLFYTRNNEKINIFIRNEIPQNIKKIWINGIYIEVYFYPEIKEEKLELTK